MAGLKQQIVADVEGRVGAMLSLVPHASAAVRDAIPGVVQSSLDFAVRVGGPAVASLVDDEHDLIRRYVSDAALKWVESVVHGLEVVKTRAADGSGA